MSTAWWDLAWVASPLWLVVNALAAFRLTRLWVADMLPPLPRMRDAVERWATERWAPDKALERHEETRHADPMAISRESGGVLSPAHDDPDRALLTTWSLYGGTPPLAYLVTCAWCSGYWISLGVFLAATLFPTVVWAFLAVPLAFSAVVGLLHTAAE